jgi:hypothetical protein
MECVRRECLSSSSQRKKMESNFDDTCERECSVCLFDLHLSAVGCHCSPDKYACLNHAKQFCTCAWGSKYLLFRYDAHELNILVEALEGKLSAVYRWARLDLGLSLSSYVSQEKMLPGGNETVRTRSSTGTDDEISQLKMKMSEAESVLKGRKTSSIFHSSHEIEMANHNSRVKKEESIIFPSNLRNPVCQLSLEDTSYAVTLLAAEELGVKKPSVSKHDNVILLSDDEGDQTEKFVSEIERETSSEKHLEISGRLAGSDYKASLCNYNNEPILTAPVTDAAVMDEKKDASSAYGERNNCSPHSMQMKDGDEGSCEPLLGSNPLNLSCHVDSSILELGRKAQDSTTRETSEHDMANSGSYPRNPQPSGGGSPNNENKPEKMGMNATSNSVDNIRPITGNPSCTSNNLDRYFRQKGPRIAKVVRRINCNVEPLEFGVVLSGKSWCNSQAIFPKGMLHAFSPLRH